MKQSDYIDYFQAKAQKLGDNPLNAKDRRFAIYTPDADMLPDVARYNLNLKEFCFLLGLYETRIVSSDRKGMEAFSYQCEVMIVRSPSNPNNFEEELATIEEAEQIAIELYRAMMHEGYCQNNFMRIFDKVQLTPDTWEVGKVMKMHDSAAGVIISFRLQEQFNFQNFQSTNRFLL